ncbi:sororin isoform 2-T2 [Pholidichthys leucotaenia]
MKEGTPRGVMMETKGLNGSERRRSPRLSSPQANAAKMAMTSVAVKRSITVRKIAPRKTVVPPEHNKENTPRRSGSEAVRTKEQQQKKPSLSTPDQASPSSAKRKKKAAMPSPILPSPPPSSPPQQQRAVDPEDVVWSQKVRRSYSRLSEKLLNSPDNREILFGFEKLQTPKVVRRSAQSKTGLEVSAGGLSVLNSFTSLLEANDDCGSAAVPEPDPNIPGVVLVKEKRRRRKKLQQMDATELDAIAAKMNAEFEEAEEFELVVE